MARNLCVSNAVKLALAVNVGFAGMLAAPGAFAQENEADELEEIITTGSRIKRKDYTSNAPVATVGFEQINMTGTVNTESLLNTLPQMVPGLDRTSNNPGNGTATVNLRGLGSNRTLVLINGTRVVPTGSGGSVDINSIPNSLIDRIEVLTGGASAVYGSDAIAGVVNFILKDDFEGVEINAGFEQTFDSDAGIYSTDITMGTNTADGRGNVTLNFSYTDRDDLFQGDRDFSNTAFFDDGNGGLEPGGSSGVPQTSIFSGALGDFAPTSFGAIFETNGDMRPFVDSGDPNDYYNYAPVNYIQLPQTRYQATALGHFDVSDRVTAYARTHFTSSKVPQQLAPTPIFQTSSFTLDGNPFLTDASQAVLQAFGDGVDSDGNGIDDTATAFVRRRLLEVGPRISDSTFTSFQVQGGIKGEISGSWDFDAYVQFGNVSGSETQSGNVDRVRFDQALLLDLVADPTGGTCTNTSGSGATTACAPINIFGQGNISDEGAAYINTRVSSAFDYEQTIVGLTFTGNLFDMPAGAVGAAIGFEKIDDEFDFRPSQALASGNIAGFNGSPPVSGSFDVSSLYGEVYVPILDSVNMELAYRSSDYSSVGSVESYKVSASWAPVDSFRLRGGYNRAVRAPSIGELFSPQGENFPGATDPCSANGEPNAATRAVCLATGVPANVVGTPAINLAAGQVRAIVGGNPLLQAEEADTYTFGFVFQPDFAEGLSLSVDYFDIEIAEFIAPFGGGANNILDVCYNDASVGGAGSDFCNVVGRRPDGTIEAVQELSQNVALITLNGFDVQASYDMDLMGGDLRLNYIGTVTQESDFEAYVGADLIKCAGNFGVDCGEPLPEYKHRMTAGWSNESWNTMLSWRYVGEVDDDDLDTVYTVDKISGFSYFDLAGTYYFTENYSLTVGIDNVTDKSPPVIGDNDEQANTYPATYDVFGRTYFVRASVAF